MVMVTANMWPSHDMTISDAVQHKLDGNDYDMGRSEVVEATANNCTEFLGKLTQMLHKKGILSNDEIEELLEWRYTVHE